MQTAHAHQPSDHKIVLSAGNRFKQRLLRVAANDELPLTLKHERIYILPTPRGLAFVGVALVMILASMNYGLNLGYALSFILVGLFASCLLSTYLNLSQLTINSITSEDTFAGSPIEYQIAIQEQRGRSRYSIDLFAMGVSNLLDIRANQSATLTLRNPDTQRGIHQLGRITVSSDFPLGLWRGWGYIHAHTNTFIYPRPESPVPTLPLSAQLNRDNQRKPTEEREFDELKRYEVTDGLSSVAWKTVARGGGWFSKKFTSSVGNGEIELSWTSTENLNNPEQRLSRLCAWVLKADTMPTPYCLRFPNHSTPVALGRKQRQNCLRYLATYEPSH